jgi:hypothetical protein
MVRAAVDGVVDYSQLDLTDPTWHLRHNLLLREMMSRDEREIDKLDMMQSLSYLSVNGVTEETWKYHSEKAFDMFDNYYRSVYVLPKQEGDREQRVTKQLSEAWSTEFGDLKDPDTLKEIDQVVAGLKAVNKARRPVGGI